MIPHLSFSLSASHAHISKPFKPAIQLFCVLQRKYNKTIDDEITLLLDLILFSVCFD